MNKIQVRIGHTPDADDAFMFYGFQTGASQVDGFEIKHIIEDIESLNLRACGKDPLECTALSLNAYLGVRDRYEMMPVGQALVGSTDLE